MAYERKVVTSSVEKQIITAMIISTNFLSNTAPIIELDFFTNEYAKSVAKWILDYFAIYKKAPELNIQKIYEANKDNLDKGTSELVASFLSKLSSEFVEGQGINDEYIRQNALKYFDYRDMEVRCTKVQGLLAQGLQDEAREVMNSNKTLQQLTSGWESPFSRQAIISTFEEDNERIIFTMPGKMGDMIGPIKRGYLIGILGAFKKGKSWLEQEFAIQALTERAKTAFFSLEMGITECRMRLYNRILGNNVDGEFLIPVFDCKSNQLGLCTDPNRTNDVTLRNSIKDPLTYKEGYAPCTFCRDRKKTLYLPETYFNKITVPKITMKQRIKGVESFEKMYGNNMFYKVYPRFSAGVDDIRRDLDILEQRENFIPDVVVVDYADILKPSKHLAKADPRHGIDDIWKNLAALASERQVAVITASQGNRSSLKKVQKEESDLAEWIGKLGHVDIFGAINQTDIEKKKGVMRFSLLAHRHKEFNPRDNVIILQHLPTGQALLDSEKAKKYHISKERVEETTEEEE